MSSVLSRLVAAILGGYALVTFAAIALAGAMPGPRSDGIFLGLMMAFPLYAAVVMWAFAVRSAKRACLGLLSAVALSGLAAWMFT